MRQKNQGQNLSAVSRISASVRCGSTCIEQKMFVFIVIYFMVNHKRADITLRLRMKYELQINDSMAENI